MNISTSNDFNEIESKVSKSSCSHRQQRPTEGRVNTSHYWVRRRHCI